MKQLLTKKTTNTIIGVLIVVLVGVFAWRFFEIGKRLTISSSVSDILDGRNVGRARQALKEVDDRARVVAALKQAVHEETDSVQGKIELLATLSVWQETRAARRALDSTSVSSRRAAAWKFHGDPTVAEPVKQIVIEWLNDEGAEKRSLAALIASKLKAEECVPVLQKAIASTPETSEQVQFANAALDALMAFRPEGFVDRAMQLALDAKQHRMVRAKAFDLVGRLEEAPVEQVQELMLTLLADRDADNLLRNKATTVLRKKKFANEEAWRVLEEVLLHKSGDDVRIHVIQRGCLWALGATAPLDRVRNLLLDRRIYNHPYFGIRVDVATGLKAMQVQEKLALEILCNYMVDTDPKDLDLLVPQEGWLSFWALTGFSYDVEERELFPNRPLKPITDEGYLRDYLWKAAQLYPGIDFAMVEAVKRMTTANLDELRRAGRTGARPRKERDLERLKRVSDTCRKNIDALLDDIREQKEAAEKAAKEREAEEKVAEEREAEEKVAEEKEAEEKEAEGKETEKTEDVGPPLPPDKEKKDGT